MKKINWYHSLTQPLLSTPVFQGNEVTGGCCSKCWNQRKAKAGESAVTEKSENSILGAQDMELSTSPQESVSKETIPMEIQDQPLAQSPTKSAQLATKKKTKKKKKPSYKSMMSSMLQGSDASRDIEKEKQALRKVTGGGAFSKIDKI